ncbi:MAG: hypothetical protein GY707_00295 [Desulfobacteraceae bacterium]|nr:hypothetical protein [Desulfobacteraceae bacterium]
MKILILLFCLITVGFAHQKPFIPPSELVEENYNNADLIVSLDIIDIKYDEKGSVFTNRGVLGYPNFKYKGNITNIYKGASNKKNIIFNRQCENKKGIIEEICKDKRPLIVFLEFDDEKKEYIARPFNVFVYSDKLHNIVNKYKMK